MPDNSPPTVGRWPPPPAGVAADPSNLKAPIPATAELLLKELGSKPLLWVGAGTSVAAGYPATAAILKALAAQSDEPLDLTAPFPRVVDSFVASRGQGELSEILQRLFQPRSPKDQQPTPVHRAIARLAAGGFFHAIATTNYDDLLERALKDEGVPVVLQPLEGNAELAADGAVRLLKLHGSLDDWKNTVLSGHSYAAFGRGYPFLAAQLDVLLRQRSVVFVGCSLQDPRLLDWLAAQTPEAARNLKPWRALMTDKAWNEAANAKWEGGHASGALARGNLKALLLRSHDHLTELWSDVAAKLAPQRSERVLTLTVGAEGTPWLADLPGVPSWQPADPLTDKSLLEELETLREWDHGALPTNERGDLAPAAAPAAAALRALAIRVGERLTAALLSPAAREALAATVRAGLGSEPPLLHLKVRPAEAGEAVVRRADRALALPWELLRFDEAFPVEEGILDLAREALVRDAEGLLPPDRTLAVVATFAAPVDAPPLDIEEEMYRLWRALGREEEEKRLLITDLGTLDELAREVERVHPPVLHFSGHGEPGALIFEDEAALSDEVPVGELVRRLRDAGPLPRLVYLSACHGATAGAGSIGHPGDKAGEAPSERLVDLSISKTETRPSTAASLHRAGFPQVVAYFGPVGDRQATRAAATFYGVLATGETARKAIRKARRISVEPLRENGVSTHVYPLGWAQIAFYHRGGDHPTTLPTSAREAPLDLERRRISERLSLQIPDDRIGEGLRGVQRLVFGFVGRRRERAQAVQRWRQGERFLVVLGLGGLGKTALCTELAPILARDLGEGGSKARVLALDGRHAAGQPSPLAALWQQVQAAHSGPAWDAALAAQQQDGLTGRALAGAVLALASENGLLVYLDDAESLQDPLGQGEIGRFLDPEVRRFWEILLEATADSSSLGVLASSRYLPEKTPPSAALALPALRRYEIVRLLGWMPTLGRLPAEERAWLAEQIDGHPRTVEYLEKLALKQEERLVPLGGHYQGGKWRQEVLEPILPETRETVSADLLLGRLWSTLPPEAQEHLGRTTVLTAPAPWPAILALGPTEGTENLLVKAGLLSPFLPPQGQEDWWAPHRLVVEEALRHWTGDPKAANLQVGEWYRKNFEGERVQAWAERAFQHLAAAGAGDEAWPVAEWLIVRLRTAGRYREALAWVEQALAAGPTGARLGLALTFEVQLGRLASEIAEQAEESLLQAVDLVEPENQSFVLDELGKLALRQGELRKAAEFLIRAVAVGIEQKGEIHPSVAISLHALAGVLQAQGDLDGARTRLERSLQISAQVFGTEIHAHVAASLHELARVLRAQGDLDGARTRLERALQITAQVFGTEIHPDVAASLHELAGVLQAQGDLDGARTRLERSLQIKAQVFGTEIHPSVAASLHALAGVLQAQGDLDGARTRLERSLQIKAQVFGTEIHPDVAASLHALASVLKAQGDLDGARTRLERVLEIEGEIYGTREHYSSAMTEVNLGFLLLEQGDTEAGGRLLAHAYSVFRKQLGPNHPYTKQLAQVLEPENQK